MVQTSFVGYNFSLLSASVLLLNDPREEEIPLLWRLVEAAARLCYLFLWSLSSGIQEVLLRNIPTHAAVLTCPSSWVQGCPHDSSPDKFK
jgi:hypothetical protein